MRSCSHPLSVQYRLAFLLTFLNIVITYCLYIRFYNVFSCFSRYSLSWRLSGLSLRWQRLSHLILLIVASRIFRLRLLHLGRLHHPRSGTSVSSWCLTCTHSLMPPVSESLSSVGAGFMAWVTRWSRNTREWIGRIWFLVIFSYVITLSSSLVIQLCLKFAIFLEVKLVTVSQNVK